MYACGRLRVSPTNPCACPLSLLPTLTYLSSKQSSLASEDSFIDGIREHLAETSLAYCITGEEKLRCLYGQLPRVGHFSGPHHPLPQDSLRGLLQHLVPDASEAQLDSIMMQEPQAEASASGMVSGPFFFF